MNGYTIPSNDQLYKRVSGVVREEGVEPSNASVMSAPAYRWPILDQRVPSTLSGLGDRSGKGRIRTDSPLLAKQLLYHWSYIPISLD